MFDQQTLTTMLTVIATGLGIAGYLHAIKRDLQADLAEKIDSVKGDVDSVKRDVDSVKGDVLDVRAAVRVLEQRTFDMAYHGIVTPPADGGNAATA